MGWALYRDRAWRSGVRHWIDSHGGAVAGWLGAFETWLVGELDVGLDMVAIEQPMFSRFRIAGEGAVVAIYYVTLLRAGMAGVPVLSLSPFELQQASLGHRRRLGRNRRREAFVSRARALGHPCEQGHDEAIAIALARAGLAHHRAAAARPI